MKILMLLSVVALLSTVTSVNASQASLREARAKYQQMKIDATARYKRMKDKRAELVVWSAPQETVDRLQAWYYRLDEVRYKAQLKFERYGFSLSFIRTDSYADSKDAERVWLQLMNRVIPEQAIAKAEVKPRGTTADVELDRAKRYLAWALNERDMGVRFNNFIHRSLRTRIFHWDATEVERHARLEWLWAVEQYGTQKALVNSQSEIRALEQLKVDNEVAEAYLAKQESDEEFRLSEISGFEAVQLEMVRQSLKRFWRISG